MVGRYKPGFSKALAAFAIGQFESLTHGEAAVPLQVMEVHAGAEMHLQPTDDQRRWMPEGGCDCGRAALEQALGRTYGPMESRVHTEVGLLEGLTTPQGTHAGAICS